jgi:SAM-dependent methyltransferase
MQRDWETHYQAGDTPWDHGGPAPGLLDFLTRRGGTLRGRVLVPGCGFGHDARAWAEAGLEAVGLDVAPSAVVRANLLHRETAQVRFVEGDFLGAGSGADPFDWLFEHTLYCAIDPALRDAYAAAAGRHVRPGGHFLAIHYLTPSSPEGPPFPCSREEILGRFDRDFELVEDWNPPGWEARLGREWMFWWRRR